jgi:hypothetical protein
VVKKIRQWTTIAINPGYATVWGQGLRKPTVRWASSVARIKKSEFEL